jgi:ATPase subunit of ABC transporter with duplicated ATPase domains
MKMEDEKKIEDEIVNPISIKNLNFSYDAGKPNIVGLDCVIPPNSRAIIVGANGAGEYRDGRAIVQNRRTTSTQHTHILFNVCTFPAPSRQIHLSAYLDRSDLYGHGQ